MKLHKPARGDLSPLIKVAADRAEGAALRLYLLELASKHFKFNEYDPPTMVAGKLIALAHELEKYVEGKY